MPHSEDGLASSPTPGRAITDRLLEHALVYRAWQAPFAERKFAPIRKHNDILAARRVLDVGCGPGTNAAHFDRNDYLGIDFNPDYIATARRRFRRDFVIADVTTYTVDPTNRFDFILLNSLLHHIATVDVRRILAHLETLLTDDGHIHILDLVLPDHMSVARLLAHWDRGDYARPLESWRTLFTERFEPVVMEAFVLGLPGVALWNMVYFKGRRRSAPATAAS
jgi:SAM-dependent methyltransferase